MVLFTRFQVRLFRKLGLNLCYQVRPVQERDRRDMRCSSILASQDSVEILIVIGGSKAYNTWTNRIKGEEAAEKRTGW